MWYGVWAKVGGADEPRKTVPTSFFRYEYGFLDMFSSAFLHDFL
jgi:hypothetical protein